ncbi:OmpA family protein [Spirosoma pollinicola]|uniref:OmpA-like domain-containing protein n=1 Tax=Spirosoma pollinicola TaxID=2057025 RepID=A0A2K8Z7R1_9BACT|nr:OmpA family protein [Spirosoma pollinicola]AUD05890.1 hypothetical protein CWM47_31030 [Spirosoma pollinicola]
MATITPLDHLRSVFTPSAVNNLAHSLNENRTNTQKAIDGLLPTVTAGVINGVSDKDGAKTLYYLLTNTPFATESDIVELIGTGSERQKATESGNGLLKKLYDQRVHQVAQETNQYSGVSLGSATTLTGLVASVLMGFLHKQIVARELTQAQLAAMLHGEVDATRSVIPAMFGVPLAWFIGTAYNPVAQVVPVRQETALASGLLWWQWLLIALGLFLLTLFLLRSCNLNKTTAEQTNDSGMAAATDTVASDLDGNEPQVRTGVDLPGGRKLNIVENSFNYALAMFLATKNGQFPKVFTFDNLTFEPNLAQVTAQARSDVADLIQIMQAYPSLRIRIEGNTDSTGTDATNDPLSSERAEAVKQALIAGGIEPDRIATRERGDTKPVATNETEAGREKNRRIDVVILSLSAPPAGPKVRVAVDAPDGRKLILTDQSFTYQLARFLATKGSRPNKSFLFDELRFDTNTARITPDAQVEVNDLVQIMKTYPKLHIRIVGYTDSVGPESINKPLSAARANFVKVALVKEGINTSRITTGKEGEEEPIATNQTAKGRHRNRRVEIVVTRL